MSLRKPISIIKKELIQYLNTWSAYIVFALVLFIEGLLFNTSSLAGEQKFSEKVLASFFYDYSGIIMVASLLLSMRLFAEERQNSTEVLYLTSPISERQVVYSKFCAAAVFLCLLLLISLYMPALILMYGKISLMHISVGYSGLFLLGCSVIAIGVFTSSIAHNQWIALILSVVLLMFFLMVWMLAKVSASPLKEIFAYLAIHNNHFSGFKDGLLNIKDIVFYVTFTLFFLELSVYSLKFRRLGL